MSDPPKYRYSRLDNEDTSQDGDNPDNLGVSSDPGDRILVASLFLLGVAALTGVVWWLVF